MAISFTQLAQSRPSGTSATQVYSPGASEEVIIKSIVVSNTSGAAATYRVFVDHDGTTYDQTTALFYDISLDGGASDVIEATICMSDTTGNVAVRTSVADALTFTLNGMVKT